MHLIGFQITAEIVDDFVLFDFIVTSKEIFNLKIKRKFSIFKRCCYVLSG